MSDPISLCDAPARFLNSEWLRLAQLKKSEANAIETLSHPEPGMIGYYRSLCIAEGRGGAAGRAAEEAEALAESIVVNIRTIGKSGQIIATGLYSGIAILALFALDRWDWRLVGILCRQAAA